MEGAEAQGRVGRDGEAVGDQVAVVAVDHPDDPQPALPRGDLGEIRRPHLVRACRLDLAGVLVARDPALGHEQAMLCHHALHPLAVDDAARGARLAQAPADHRAHPPGAKPRPIAADVQDVRLDDQRVGQRRPRVPPRPAYHDTTLDGLDGLAGGRW